MKKILSLVLMSICMFGFGKGVNAIDLDSLPNENISKEQSGNIYNLKLQQTANENLRIRSGENVVLDLNGKTLSNDAKENAPTIWIEKGATLTIKGSGYIQRPALCTAEGSTGTQAVINNWGTLNLESGYILPTSASIIGINNFADATVNISGGMIGTTEENTYGLWNNGKVNITGGQFNQGLNANQPIVVNGSTGNLNITGGNFINTTGNNVPSLAPVGGSKTTITGGKFEYQDLEKNTVSSQDISQYLPTGYTMDKYGNVIKPASENEPTTSEENSQNVEENNNVKNPNTTDNIYSWVSIIAFSIIGLSYIIKKKIFN